ncbi:MAG: hypothetical protein D6732_13495 [Methanobacteriota archaeon]|nr:MAG: hypothetical protein D6732_13495 [Euryarchaeota archaeon]
MLIGVLLALSILWSGCSRIEIEKPSREEADIVPPYTLIVKHTGCGTVKTETFHAEVVTEVDTDTISYKFTYNEDTWTATDYSLPMGMVTLKVRANVVTGPWCYEYKTHDERTFFVAPCDNFQTAFGMFFELVPDTIVLTYGDNELKIGEGDSVEIVLPKNSPLLNGYTLPARVRFTFRNSEPANFKMLAVIMHGQKNIGSRYLAFCGEGEVEADIPVRINQTPEALQLAVVAPNMYRTPGDDTVPTFFRAKLQLIVLED